MAVIEDEVIVSDDEKSTYLKIMLQPGVLIVPVKVNEHNRLTFILVEQYRHPLGSKMLEFPGGAIDAGETSEQAAIRELEEETGYIGDRIKFVYKLHQLPSDSPSPTYVYLALVKNKKENHELLPSEANQGLIVREVSDDDFMKMIRENEIIDSKTLASAMVVLFQNKNALEYILSIGKD